MQGHSHTVHKTIILLTLSSASANSLASNNTTHLSRPTAPLISQTPTRTQNPHTTHLSNSFKSYFFLFFIRNESYLINTRTVKGQGQGTRHPLPKRNLQDDSSPILQKHRDCNYERIFYSPPRGCNRRQSCPHTKVFECALSANKTDMHFPIKSCDPLPVLTFLTSLSTSLP